MTRLAAKPLPLFIVAALAIGGCGNSDEPAAPRAATTSSAPSSAKPGLSKQEFIRATTRICDRISRQAGAFYPLGTDPTTRRANRSALIGLIRRQVDEIRALGHPVGGPGAGLDGLYRDVDAALNRAEMRDAVNFEKGVAEALARHAKTLAEYMPNCH